MLRTRFLSLLMFGFFLAAFSIAQSSAPATPVAAPSNDSVKIGPGDLLDLTVFDTQELSGRYRVSEKGDIDYTIIGTVHVAGMTANEASRLVEQQLLSRQVMKDPHVTVFISEYATQGITVGGEVKNPGIYPSLGGRTMLDIISASGGVLPTAGKTVSIVHHGNIGHPDVVRLGDITSGRQLDPVLQPGDQVIVGKSGVVYVVGDVGRPGGFLVENNQQLTILQAVALAEGVHRTAALNKAKLIRKTPDGNDEIALDLKNILQGKQPDAGLQDGDILFVPASTGKIVGYGTAQSALGLIGSAAIYHF